MLETLTKLIPDLLLVVGATSVAFGGWLIYEPVGYVVAGAFMIYAGLRLA